MLATLYFSHIIIPMEQQSNNLKNLEHLDFLLYAKLAHLEDMIEIATYYTMGKSLYLLLQLKKII